MYFLTAEDIITVHDRAIAEAGGSLGVREPGLLIAISEKPNASFGGEELYPTLFDKAAAVCEGICNYHVFVDGNKRTAITCLEYMLFRNGYGMEADQAAKETFILGLATSHPDLMDVASWIQEHSKEL